MEMVLDKGYVNLVDHMGNDLSVINAARVSFMKASTHMVPEDQRLLRYLIREGHTSPFRHACVELEMYSPLMVARQVWKYVVGGDHTVLGWNESSRRYVTEEPEFYLPEPSEWRSAPSHKKQGSGEPVPLKKGKVLTQVLEEWYATGEKMFREVLEAGIAPEQARLFLPAYGMYVRWRWSTSLQGVIHMLDERLEEHAQYECRLYAQAVGRLVEPLFPECFRAIRDVLGATRPTGGLAQMPTELPRSEPIPAQ